MQTETPDQTDEGEATGLALEVCLTVIAGYVDATAFVHFGGLFVSFMSGNSTKLASLPTLGRGTEAIMAAAAVFLFVMGAFAGRLLAEATGAWRRPALLWVTAALLALATLAGELGPSPTATALAIGLALGGMTMAMGVMNAVLRKVGSAKVAATYVTGVLFHLGQALAERVMGRPAPWPVYLLSWLGMVLGASLGAVACVHLGLAALAAPAVAAVLLALVSGAQVRRAQAARSPR